MNWDNLCMPITCVYTKKALKTLNPKNLEKNLPGKPVAELEGFPGCAFSSLPLHQVPAASLQTGSLCLGS